MILQQTLGQILQSHISNLLLVPFEVWAHRRLDLLFAIDSSPIFIANDAPSSNEMSINLFQDWSFFKIAFGNVLIFQVVA